MNDQFLDFIKKRGFVSQCTDEVNLKKPQNKTIGYIGLTVRQTACMLAPYYP